MGNTSGKFALLAAVLSLAFLAAGCAQTILSEQPTAVDGGAQTIAEDQKTALPVPSVPEPRRYETMVVEDVRTAANYRDCVYFIRPMTMYTTLRREGSICALTADESTAVIYPHGVKSFYILDDWIYATSDALFPAGVIRIRADGTSVEELFDGNLEYVDTENSCLYYTVNNVQEGGLYRYRIDDGSVETLFSGYCQLVYRTPDSIYLCHSQIGQSDLYRANLDGSDLRLLAEDRYGDRFGDYYIKIPKLTIEDDWITYSVGCFEGSASVFYGDDYRMDLDGGQKERLLIDQGGASYRTAGAFSESSTSLCVRLDGEAVAMDCSAEDLSLQPYIEHGDRVLFSKAEEMDGWVYFRADAWGYRDGNGWRDVFLAGGVYRVRADGSELQILDLYVGELEQSGP